MPLKPETCNFRHAACSLCKRLVLTGETFFHPHRCHPTIGYICYDCGTACRLEFPAHHAGQPISLDPFCGG